MPCRVPVLRLKCLSAAGTHQRGRPFQGTQPGLGRAKLFSVWGPAGLDSWALWCFHPDVGGAEPGEGPSWFI